MEAEGFGPLLRVNGQTLTGSRITFFPGGLSKRIIFALQSVEQTWLKGNWSQR